VLPVSTGLFVLIEIFIVSQNCRRTSKKALDFWCHLHISIRKLQRDIYIKTEAIEKLCLCLLIVNRVRPNQPAINLNYYEFSKLNTTFHKIAWGYLKTWAILGYHICCCETIWGNTLVSKNSISLLHCRTSSLIMQIHGRLSNGSFQTLCLFQLLATKVLCCTFLNGADICFIFFFVPVELFFTSYATLNFFIIPITQTLETYETPWDRLCETPCTLLKVAIKSIE